MNDMRKLIETIEEISEDPSTDLTPYIENEINDLHLCISELGVLAQSANSENTRDYLQNAVRLINRAIENLEYAKTDV